MIERVYYLINAIKSLKKKAKEMLAEVLPKEQQKALKQDIAKEVLRGFDYTGKSSQLAGVLDKYRKQISTLYDKLRDSNRHNRATNRLLDKVQKIKNWKTGAFVNSSKYRTKLFKGSIERLAMIKNRGNLNQSGTRRIFAGLAEWYTQDNPLLGYVDSEHKGQYNEEIAAILQAVAQNQKPLTDEQVDLITFLQEKSGISDYKGLLEWYTKDNLKDGYSAEVKSLLRELASETTFTTEELIALDKVVGYFGHLTYSTIDFLKRAFVYFGYLPAIIQTDNGTEFTTPKIAKKTTISVVDKFLNKYGIKHKLIRPHTPRHNGKVERSHRSDQESFYNYLTYSTYEELKEKMLEWLNRYNNRPHSSLRNRAGKRVWLTPLEKRAELMEDYQKDGFKDEFDSEFRIRFLRKVS